ncbi:hypothetical protein [Acrocarpospora sp. B8E8]
MRRARQAWLGSEPREFNADHDHRRPPTARGPPAQGAVSEPVNDLNDDG